MSIDIDYDIGEDVVYVDGERYVRERTTTTDEQHFWHRMADEQPTDERGKYLLLGKRGAMYLASGFHVWEHSGRRSFYIPNNRSGYVDFDKVKAWAVVPEMEVGE